MNEPTGPTLSELRSRPHWSFSRINALANYCPLAWSFHYVQRLEGEFRPVSLVFGGAYHSALSLHAVRRMKGKSCSATDCGEVLTELLLAESKSSAPKVRLPEGETIDSLAAKGRDMLKVQLATLDPEEEVIGVGVPFSVLLTDASGGLLDAPLIGEYDLVVWKNGIRTIVDWKTSARRWPTGKETTDLQPTCYLWAERRQERPHTRFRFDIVTKTKSPTVEQRRATRTMDQFLRLGELVRVLERLVAGDCFHPRECGWECANCPYVTACAHWHRQRARAFVLVA